MCFNLGVEIIHISKYKSGTVGKNVSTTGISPRAEIEPIPRHRNGVCSIPAGGLTVDESF